MPLDPDIPWGWNLLLFAIAAAVVPIVTSWIANRGTKAKLAAIAHEVRPNSGTSLADAVNRIEAAQVVATEQIAGIREDVGGIHSEIRDVRQDIAGVRADARHDRRVVAQAQQSLDEHLQAVPGLLAETVAKAEASHIRKCPLRNDKPDTTRTPRR